MSDKTIKVLLVEDNHEDVRLIKEMLVEARGISFDLKCSYRLSTGLKRLNGGGIDVVLLDLALPDSSGLDTFSRVHDEAPHVPIIVLTSLDDEALALQAVREGAQDYMIKGQVDSNLLVRAVRYAIERKRAEEALRESEERYRLLFENVTDIVFSVDREFRIRSVSPSIEGFSGYRPEEVIDRRLVPSGRKCLRVDDLDSITPEYREQVHSNAARVVAGERIALPEYEFITKDGRKKFVEISASPLFNKGNVIGALCVARDKTEREKWEQELLKYQDRLQSLASQLSLSEERERRRISGHLHDHVGQILLASKIKAGILRNSLSSPRLIDRFDEILEMLDQAIDEVRLLTIEISPPALYALGLESAVEWLVERNSIQYGIKSEFKDDGQSKPLEDDVRVVLFQTVRELLINTVKHSQANSVKVAIRRKGDDIEVSVKDDGVGFNTATLASSWDEAKGFGLFNIQERLSGLGGNCEVISKPGRGTLVMLAAPLKIDEETTRG